jgi:hypothetical protein
MDGGTSPVNEACGFGVDKMFPSKLILVSVLGMLTSFDVKMQQEAAVSSQK